MLMHSLPLQYPQKTSVHILVKLFIDVLELNNRKELGRAFVMSDNTDCCAPEAKDSTERTRAQLPSSAQNLAGAHIFVDIKCRFTISFLTNTIYCF